MPTPREQMDALFDALVGFAKQMLEERHAFYPFAAEVTTDGVVQMVTASLDADNPSSEVVLDSVEARLRAAAASGEVQATGVCADVRLAPRLGRPETDAIRVDIEHAAADPVRVFVEYGVDESRRLVYREPVAQPGSRRVFVERGSK
jgi:hypothetical protein